MKFSAVLRHASSNLSNGVASSRLARELAGLIPSTAGDILRKH